MATATVSAVVNDSAYVSPQLRARVLAAVRDLDYAPSLAARTLARGRSQLIALVVADLANPFFARVVCAAEAAVTAWGYALLVFNSDEKPENERRILARIRTLSCDGMVLVPVGGGWPREMRENDGSPIPTVLFGRTMDDRRLDSVTIDNVSAGRQVTNYLLDLGHRHIGSITGPLNLTTGSGVGMACCKRWPRAAWRRGRGMSGPGNSARMSPIRWPATFSARRTGRARCMSPTA